MPVRELGELLYDTQFGEAGVVVEVGARLHHALVLPGNASSLYVYKDIASAIEGFPTRVVARPSPHHEWSVHVDAGAGVPSQERQDELYTVATETRTTTAGGL